MAGADPSFSRQRFMAMNNIFGSAARVKNNGSIAVAMGNCIGVHYPSYTWAAEAGAVVTFDKASSTSDSN